MKKILTAILIMAFASAMSSSAMALEIPTSNNVYIFEAGNFEAIDGWYVGQINVGWHGNGNKKVDVTWRGNEGEVIVTPYIVESNKQETGILGVKIKQTSKKQTVVFTLTKRNGQKLSTEIIVPPVYSGPVFFDVLRTAINPGYYFSGILIDMGVTLSATAVDKDTFYAKARVTEYNGTVQGSFGNFAWDPEKEDYALGDGWARWNIVDAYVSDEHGNRVDKGRYVKIDIEYEPRTEPSGSSGANRYDVPATRAAWYTGNGYIAYASVEVELTQQKEIPGIADVYYVQDEIKHDPLFDKFEILDAPGGGKYALYRPENASESNKRPLLVWFHGTGERYFGDNPGGNLIGNRVLAFADKEFQETLGGCYILAPQSTTTGWNSSRLNDMEELINMVIANNHIDPDRIFVGGLSMGTAMTIPLITSTTENKIDYAAAILCSGGSINATQAQIIADKGIAMYLVGNTSDWAASNLPSSYNNLLSAGVDVKMKLYPAGPVFDGKYYYGAHDSWNYIYNNLVEDENGETIFEWLARQSR